MHVACMATKTISIDLEAHRKLSAARRSPKESFSQVIRRARWDAEGPATGKELLSVMSHLPKADDELIHALEATQAADHPPIDPWDKSQ